MTDLYDVHNARFIAPTAEEMDTFLKEQFNVTDTPQHDPTDARRIIDALTVPFRRDQISQRKIGGRMLDYVEGHEYITRLNEASPAWSFRMTRSDMQPLHVTRYDKQTRQPYETDLPCLIVHGELTIPGVGTRAGIGVQMVEDNAGEDVMKGALTDCLKNCAKYFGLGLHMYSGDMPAPAQEPSGASVRPARLSQVQSPPNGQNAQHAPAQRVSDADYMAGHGATEAPLPPKGGRPASEKQVNAVFAIAKRAGANPEAWAVEAGADGTEQLSSQQASWIIEKYGSQR